MAAPATADYWGIGYRDAKGNTSRNRVLIGAASATAQVADLAILLGHLQAVTNAHVYATANADLTSGRTYGTNAEYPNVEDKAVLVFVASDGSLHRFQIPAPKLDVFLADGETVDPAQADVVALVADFASFIYAHPTDTGPMATFLGGNRIRRKTHRRFNIFTKNPALTGPGE